MNLAWSRVTALGVSMAVVAGLASFVPSTAQATQSDTPSTSREAPATAVDSPAVIIPARAFPRDVVRATKVINTVPAVTPERPRTVFLAVPRINVAGARRVSLTADSRSATGVCSTAKSGRNRIVRFAGPTGVEVAGRAACQGNGDFTIDVLGGRGVLGAILLASNDFDGTVRSRNGVESGSVTVALPRHPRVIPEWRQRASAKLTLADGAWSGDVSVTARRGSGSLKMTGPLERNGSYRLKAKGKVTFADSRIPLRGTYSSAGYRRIASARVLSAPIARASWNISGKGAKGTISGVRVRDPRIRMTQGQPGVTGSGTLMMPGSVRVQSYLKFLDEDNWVVTAVGSPTQTWRPEQIQGLTVTSGDVTGDVTNTNGNITWAHQAPMAIVDEALTMTGTFAYTGPTTWRLRMDNATGSILGAQGTVPFSGVAGDVIIKDGAVNGSVAIKSSGTLLSGLPKGWTPATTMNVTFAKEQGQIAVVKRSVSYTMSNKGSAITLSGEDISSSGFKLTASGSVKLGSGSIPFGGTYESAGYVSNGVTRVEPYYSMSGSIGDAAGGKIPVGSGVAMKGGSIGFGGGQKNPTARSIQRSHPDASDTYGAGVVRLQQRSTTTTISGTVNISLSNSSSFTLQGTLVYTDDTNWLLTLISSEGDPWNPWPGLTIQTSSFHGTVESVNSNLTWNMYVDEVDWQNISTGVNGRTGFSLTDQCPLTEHCPGTTGVVYVGFTNGTLSFPNPDLDLSMQGAFTADAKWARFDASAGDVTWDGITVNNSDLAIWYGSKDDDIEGLDMPDLSSENNGFGIEFSGDFKIDVPNVGTVATQGVVTWSPDGVVMGQVAMGGSVPATESDDGVQIDSATLAGFAWTNLDSEPTVVLNGSELTLEAETSYLTAAIEIPAETMQGIGAGNQPATVTADGWFDGEDFSLDTAIEVNLSDSGFTLSSVGLHIGKASQDYELSFQVNASMSISGNTYPVTATLLGEMSGSQYTVKLTLGVRGGVKEASAVDFNGGFDTATLLPSGDFEPVSRSLIDGSFDAKPDRNVFSDGTFEAADTTGNLVTNPDFETNIQPELMPNGDFESGSNGNLLDNGNAEDGNALLNGDFESGYSSWDFASGFDFTLTNPSDNAPSTSIGQQSYILKNNNGATSNTGLSQNIPWAPSLNASYTLSAWIKSPDGSNSRIGLYVNQTGTASGCSTQSTSTTSQIFTSSSVWTQVFLPVTGTSCRTGFTITLDPIDGGGRVILDSMAFVLNSSSSVVSIPNTNRPSLVDRFDVMPPINKSSGVTNTYDFGNTLRNGGCSSNYWKYNTGTYGYANGDFDVSINTMHLTGNNKRDMGSFGFWLNGSGTSATGFSLRAQTSNGDGGFWQVSGSSSRALNSNGNYMPDLAQNVWYNLRVTAYGNWVTGKVTRLDTGEQIWNSTVNVGAATSSLPHSGTFGQVPDSLCSTEGTRWDEFNVYQGTTYITTKNDPANAHSGNRYLAMTGTTSNWDAQYSTGEQPDAGMTYSYSAWVRSRGGNVFGNLFIDTPPSDAAPYESNAVGFTATSSWQLVTVSLKIANAGHTDIRPGFLDMAASGIEIDVDDQVFAVAPWVSYPSPVDAVQIVSSDAHGGTGALSLTTRRTDKASVYYDLAGWPGVGTTYTVTAWMKSATPVNVDLKLSTLGGTVEERWISVVTDSTWRQYTVALTTTGNGHSNLRLNVDIIGNQYENVLIDDVSILATGQQSDQGGSVSDLADPTPWTNLGGENKLLNGSGGAHTGMGYMAITPAGNYTQGTAYTVAATPKVGATYTATAWIRGSGCGNAVYGDLTLSSGLESKTFTRQTSGSYELWTTTLPITKSGATALTMTVANTQNNSSCYLFFDDVGIQLSGLGLNDPWSAYAGNGYISMTAFNDASKAHEGTNALEVKATGSSGYMYVDSDFRPVAGTQQTMSIWVRSPNGQPFYGALGLISYGGDSNTDDESRFVNFTTSGTVWQQVFVTLPIRNTGNKLLRSEINIDSVGVVGHIDEVSSNLLPEWAPWEPNGNTVNEMIVADKTKAAEGSSYVTVQSVGSQGGGIIASTSETIRTGAEYTMSMWVRSTTGVFVDGQFGMAYKGTSDEAKYQYFTADSDWQQVTMSFTATKNNTFVEPLIDIFGGPRLLDIDSIEITPQAISQEDPWLVRTDMNATATAVVYDDPTRARDGSFGFLEVYKPSGNGAEVYHDMSVVPAVGETYTGSVWVRSSSGIPVDGSFGIWANGGSAEWSTTGFTATSEWQLLSVRLPILNNGHTSMRLAVDWYTNGVTLDIDDAEVQKVDWQSLNSSTTQQKLIMDSANAQSGSGYLHMDYNGTGDGVVYQDTRFTPTGSNDYTLSAWVRSPTGRTVTGRLYVQAYGGTGKDQNSPDFTISGTQWQQVSVTLPSPPSNNNMVRNHIVTYTSGVPLDIDAVTFTKVGAPIPGEGGNPDGVTQPLANPQAGYAYLWDDAFGIPGMHLWDMTAQVEAYNVFPYVGLGVGATVYMDPTKMDAVMTGTDWVQGTLAVNITTIDPCFSFGFDATPTNAAIAIDGGVFSTKRFTFGIAPTGCQVGDYVVPQGVTLGIDTAIGDTSVHLDLLIGKDEESNPTFYANAAIHDAVIAGTTYNTMELIIDITAEEADISFVGDMTLPMGGYYSDLDLSMNGELLHMEGNMSLTDWELAGGTMDVDSFNYYMSIDVPFGSGSCANFTTGINGVMSMGSKTGLNFDGSLGIECGRLKTLHMEFAYLHRAVEYDFLLDYNSSTNRLAGGFKFDFERSTSWKFFGHRYNRHPKIKIAMQFSMDISKPASTTDVTLGGSISVSGGNGALQCSFSTSGGDDECSFNFQMGSKYGSYKYADTW